MVAAQWAEDVKALIDSASAAGAGAAGEVCSAEVLNSRIQSLAADVARSDSKIRMEMPNNPQLAEQLARALYTLAARTIPENEANSKGKTEAPPASVVQTSTFALRLARNIVTCGSSIQDIFWQQTDRLEPLLFFVTAFAQVHDEVYRPLTRAAAQLLSNLAMNNQNIQEQIWSRFVAGKASDSSGSQLSLRLLASTDHTTLVATVLLLLSCCRGSQNRCHDFATSASVRPLLEALLDIFQQSCRDAQTEQGQSVALDQLDELSNMIYTLFSHLFASGHFGLMLRTLTPSAPEEEAEEGIPRILVNNSQRTLLGLFDAYIHSGAEGYRIDGDVTGASSPDIEVLLASFTSLCIHLQSVVARLPDPSNPDDTSSEQLKVDGRTIIGVPQTIVIMVQCMVEWIMLSSKEIAEASDSNAHTAGRELLRKLQEQAKRGLDQHSRVANTEHMSSPSDEHIGLAQDPIGATVVLLRVIAAAFPAESPFKNTAPSQNGHSNSALPAGHVLSHTGTSSQNEQASRIASQLQAAGGPGKTAFSYLKRELVRLIGVVSFVEPRTGSVDEKEAVRHVQDYVRTLDGLLVVLSMTQLDELNPYIREHAVFTLRNLLAGNQANQELIAQLRKVEE